VTERGEWIRRKKLNIPKFRNLQIQINLKEIIKMKKSILSLFLLLVVATVTNAAPRFGVVAEQTKGLGAFITDDMYNAQLTFKNSSDDLAAADKTENTQISFGANYKVALDSVTALTAGVTYQTTSGKTSGTDIDKENTLALVAGFERALSSNIVLTTQADIYSQNTSTSTGSEVKTTSIFSNGRVGVAYLF
jgi:hypothetical protein